MRLPASRSVAALLTAMAATLLVSVSFASAPPDGKEPKRKDSKARFQPKQVKYKAKVTPATAKPGDTVTYSLEVTIDEPWHIYAFEKEDAPESKEARPEPTKFDFFDTDGLTLSGDWTTDPKPTARVDPAFNNAVIESHEGKVTFQVKMKVPKDAKPGKHILRNQIYFQACDPTKCLPPAFITVPDAALTISGGGSSLLREAPGNPVLVASLIATTPSAAPAPKKVGGDLGKAIDGGLLAFLLYSALGGLVALLMPCVWPMIPITVNFFVKQGEAKKGATLGLAIAYCLAIIGIFTALGFGVTLLKGAGGASDLGNNPWLNLVMGVAFIALGLSLLGLFELRMPTSFLNFSSQREGRGGLVGVMFMALTLTLTSFTCTAPVVGALLGQAAAGQRLYPLLGMLVFSTVLALPFFVMALMPSLLHRLPRSGDWMNAVKVVGGLVEVGAAFKFLNTAEISFGTAPENAIFNTQAILTAWVVIALVCGVYLLGLFRTDHDHDAVRVGPMRLVSGVVFLAVALMLAPALFGVKPKNKLYEAIAGILPADSSGVDVGAAIVQNTSERIAGLLPSGGTVAAASSRGVDEPARVFGPVKAKSDDPKVALLEEKKFHGVAWGLSYDAALAEAKAKNRLVLIDFTGVNCANCRTVEATIMPRPDVVTELKKFVTVSLFNDFVDIATLNKEQKRELADANKDIQLELTDSIATPQYVVVNGEGKLLGKVEYSATDSDFLVKFLRKMQAEHKPEEKVAAK